MVVGAAEHNPTPAGKIADALRLPLAVLIISICTVIDLDAAGAGRSASRPILVSAQGVALDIPAQPLAKALRALSAATGLEILVDARDVSGRMSPAIKAVIEPDDALAIMLTGSGLLVRRFGPDAVILSAAPPAAPPASGQWYFGEVQRAVERALCRESRTVPGRYRFAVKIWIGRAGTVLWSKRLDSTGDDSLDADLDHAMQQVKIGRAPPPDLPQPIALVVSRGEPSSPLACADGESTLRRASSQ